MSLFFAHHEHSADNCPARDPEMGQMLLKHLTKSNARRFGVDLLADAVLDHKHTLVLIAECEDLEYLREFLKPFAEAGSVEISAASTCEDVVERRGCDPVPAGG